MASNSSDCLTGLTGRRQCPVARSGRVFRPVAGGEHHHHGAADRRVLLDLLGQREAVDAGHVGIGEYQAEGLTGSARRRRSRRASVAPAAGWGSSANCTGSRRGCGGSWRCRRPQAPASRAGGGLARNGSAGSAVGQARRTVKWKRLPWPTSLSTQIRPSISATSRAAMASPSPVPPWRRVVELSACSNISKITGRFSSGMPIPVSLTAKCKSDVCRRTVRRDLQAHFSLLGELDGVADQIDHDLAEAVVIADDGAARRDG